MNRRVVAPNPVERAPALRCHSERDDAVRDTVQHLGELHAALTSLLELAGEKLAALRAADTVALHRCAVQEEELLARVMTTEQQQPALLARLAQSLRCESLARARLTEIADRLPEPAASVLRARNVALRETARQLQRKNRLAAEVARNLHRHLRGIFADAVKSAQESLVYGPQGSQHTPGTRCWVDAVG